MNNTKERLAKLTLDDTARIIDEYPEDWAQVTKIATVLFGQTPASMPSVRAMRLAVLKAHATLIEFRYMVKTIADNNKF